MLAVVVDRAVGRERLWAEHRCVRCRHGLGVASLAPLRSWFASCAHCGRRPGWRYPLTDLSAAAAFALVGARFGFTGETVIYGALAAVLVILAVIDLETHLLPNVITYPTFVVGLVVVLVTSPLLGRVDHLASALVGGAVAFTIMLVFHVISPAGLGLGDVKLAPTLGLFLGWLTTSPLTAVNLVLYAVVIGSAGVGIIGLAAKRIRGIKEVPFGPGLVVGTLTIIAVSSRLAP